MLRPALLLVAIITVSGYFQLFAEPYVMTQGNPLQSTVSVLYFMYQEGFTWWSLGRASAIAFLLFALILAHDAAAVALGPARRDRHERVTRAGVRLLANGLLFLLALFALFPLLWMLSVSLMHPGEASSLPPPLLPKSATLANYRELFERAGMGRYLANSLLVATAITLLSLLFNLAAGYAFAKLRFAGRDRLFQTLLTALVIPAQVAMIPLFLHHEMATSRQQLRRRDRAGHGDRVRHFSGASVRALDSRRIARSGAHRRRRRMAHLRDRSCCHS